MPDREVIEQYKASLGPLQEYIPGLDKLIAGNEHHGRCPFCLELSDPDSPCFWVWAESQRYQCRKCDAKGDIIDYIEHTTGKSLFEQLTEAGLLEEDECETEPAKRKTGPVKLKGQAGGKEQVDEPISEPTKDNAPEKNDDGSDPDALTEKQKKMAFLWSKCRQSSIAYNDYLKMGRGIDLGTKTSPAILWNSYTRKGASEKTEMIVMPLTRPGDPSVSSKVVPQSLLRIWLRREGGRLVKKEGQGAPKAQNWKSGAQTGRAVWFFPDMCKEVVGHGEGQETMLAVFAATGMNVAASLTTSGINNIAFFPEQKKVYFFIDQDAPKWSEKNGKQVGCQGQISGIKAGLRAEKKGLDAWVVTPTSLTFSGEYEKIKKVDFNDLLVDDPSGESIRDRVAVAVKVGDINWEPPPDKKVEGRLLDEDGNLIPQNHAAMFLSLLTEGKFAFSVIADDWYQFNGASWQRCEKGEFDIFATGVFNAETGATGYRDSYYKGAITILKRSGSVLLPEPPDGLVPFLNGTLVLKDKEFVPTTHKNALLWHLPYNYDENADCPFFKKWLDDACDDPTGDTQWLIRGFFNTCFIERVDLQYFFNFKGLPGTGKGTLLRVVTDAVGRVNTQTSCMHLLANNQFEPRRYHGKRVVFFNEVPRNVKIQNFLSLTGRDPMRYELKRKNDDKSFIYTGAVALTINDSLTTNDQTTGAIDRRRLTVEFNKVFSRKEKLEWAKNGGENQFKKEMVGIILWALDMSKDEVSDVFHNPPAKVKQSNEQAARANSPLLHFLSKNVVYSENSYVHVGVNKVSYEDGEKCYIGEDVKIYPRYLSWCDGENKKPLARSLFLESAINMINTRIVPDGGEKVFQMDTKKFGGYPIMHISLVTDIQEELDVSPTSQQQQGLGEDYTKEETPF